MIKKILQGNDLKNNIYDIVDTTQQSFDYFCVDLPERFYIGKNPLTIKPTNNLLKGSPIKIDIVDVDGNWSTVRYIVGDCSAIVSLRTAIYTDCERNIDKVTTS